jgi:hypothetical protein
MPRRLVE